MIGALPWLAAALAAAAVVAGAVRVRAAGEQAERAHRMQTALLVGAAGLAAALFLYLVSRFFVGDLSYESVFLYTRLDLPLRYRIAGAWTSREGSLLLWALYLAGTAAVLAWLHGRRPAVDGAHARGRAWSDLFLSGFAFVFLVGAALQHPFSATPGFFLESRPEGNGMNPSLLSPFMLIHPPIMFLAYALATVPAAAALGHLASGTDRWSRVAMAPSRFGWLLYTFAMGLGGIWAYYTLGFGGFWAWDPVEVANLLPWLALSVYLHAQLHHRRHGGFRVAGPFLALLPFLLTVFSTVSTRSGLWVSVHAFTDPTNTFNPDAPGRLLDILAAEPSLGFYAAIILATTAVGLALWARRLSQELRVLDRTSRVVAGGLSAYAAFAVLAPASALGALFEAAHRLAPGQTGLGLLGITVPVFLLAALPAFLRDAPERQGPPRRPRRGLRAVHVQSLAYASVLILGLSLLVLFLFHVAAANGWSTAFYTDRLPFLATPALLALLLFQGHGAYGRRAAVAVTAGALLLALVAALATALLGAGARAGGVHLAVLAAALVAVAFDRVRRAADARGAAGPVKRRNALAGGLLLAAALLDVAFWLNPPSTLHLGPLVLHPVWPVQAVLGSLALVTVLLVLRCLAGAPLGPRGLSYVLAGGLGAYYVAPVLALAAWGLGRDRPAPGPSRAARGRLHQAALHGIHLAVAVAVLGYATSTYLQDGQDEPVRLGVGDTAQAGALGLRLDGVATEKEEGTPWARAVLPAFTVTDGEAERGTGTGILYWEPQTRSHFPLPTTLRLYDRDVYWSITGVCTDPEGACDDAKDWVRAFESSERLHADRAVTAVEVSPLAVLPGLGLVWAALMLFVGAMALLMTTDRGPRDR